MSTDKIVSLDQRLRDVEEVWRLRAQVLEHLGAIEQISERMLELPHVWGVCPDSVAGYLDEIEAMLTPADCEPGEEPKAGDQDYSAWRLLVAFKTRAGEKEGRT